MQNRARRPPPPPPPRASDSEVLAAALENRAGEIGLAFLDARRGRLRLNQFIETSRCRTHVRSALRASGCSLVLLPASSVATAAVGRDDDEGDDGSSPPRRPAPRVLLLGLAAAIAAEDIPVLPWSRSAFDDTKASVALSRAAGGWESAAAVGKAKYLSVGAAGAVLDYLASSRGSLPAPKSLSISLESSRDYLAIDGPTAAALCLVSSSSSDDGADDGGKRGRRSLFHALAPGARTDAGRSLLRASLLQPLAHAPTIAARHEAVAELASEAATPSGDGGGATGASFAPGPRGDVVARALAAVPRDLDRALGILSLRPCRGNDGDADPASSSSAAAAASRVDALARGLRSLHLTLSSLPDLASALGGCRSPLLVAVRANVGHEAFAALARTLRSVLEDDPSASFSTSAASAAAGGGGRFDDDDEEEEEERQRCGYEEADDDGEEEDDDGESDVTSAATTTTARPRNRRRVPSRNDNGSVRAARPPEPIRSAYTVRAERGGLLEAAREALSRAAADAAEEAAAIRARGASSSRRRGRGGNAADDADGSLSPAWRACLSRAKLTHTTRKGFVIVLPKAPVSSSSSSSRLDSDRLPSGLSLAAVRPRGGGIEVSTPTLATLNARAAAALADCLLLSEQALSAASAAALEQADFLHRLVDNVALLDALQAFATWARRVGRKGTFGGGVGAGRASDGGSRHAVAVPRLVGPKDPLALGGLRCALLESFSRSDAVPNDVYLALMGGSGGGNGGGEREKSSSASLLGCLHVVTGPNSGGKSTYLRSIGLAVVLSQAGGLPPARVACLPVLKRLSVLAAGGGGGSVSPSAAARTDGAVDDFRALASSAGFADEAAHLARVVEDARECPAGRCLVLLDEPGRGTSSADGAPLAWAAAEAIASGGGGGDDGAGAGQRCVVATHHPALSSMEDAYPFARSWHMVAECRGVGKGNGPPSSPALSLPRLRFAWKVAPGPCQVKHYGLALAPSVGVPRRVVDAAAAVASAIERGGGEGEGDEGEQGEKGGATAASLTSAQRSLLEAAHRLRCLAAAFKAGADEGAIAASLSSSNLRAEAARALAEAEEAGVIVEP